MSQYDAGCDLCAALSRKSGNEPPYTVDCPECGLYRPSFNAIAWLDNGPHTLRAAVRKEVRRLTARGIVPMVNSNMLCALTDPQTGEPLGS